MAGKEPSVLDSIIGGSFNPLIPYMGPMDDSSPTPGPLLPALSGASVPASKAPTLGTEDQLTAPAQTPQPLEEGTWSPDRKTLTLPPQTKENSSGPISPEEHVGILKTIGRLAAGATGLESPNSSPQANLGSKIGGLIGRTGASLALAAGTPEEKQLAEEQLQQPLKMAQIANEMQYRNGLLGAKAAANENTAKKTDLQYGPEGTSRLTAEAAQARAESAQQMADEHTKQIEASLRGLVHVERNLAHALGRDDLADQDISPIAYQQQIGNVVKSRGFHTVDTGKDGPDAGLWVIDNVGRKIYQVSPFSPANARGASYGANRPVQILDPNTGMPRYAPAGQAYALQASPAGLGTQLMSKQAQFSDIYSGIGSMRSAINGMAEEGGPQLSAGTIGKLVLATRETDPTIAKEEFDTILGSEQLTPAQQDFVVAVQQLNERAMSLRNLAGMGNASDSLRAAIRATLPSAKSGDIGLMRKQLDAVTNLVDNLHTGVPAVNVPQTPAPKKGTNVPKPATPKQHDSLGIR